MKIAYCGNFQPAHSTETHIAFSLEALGHEVIRIQEGSMQAWRPKVASRTSVGHMVRYSNADLFLWTQTLSLAEQMGDRTERMKMLEEINEAGIPTAGFHLDRWWGLSRENRVHVEPFFKVNHLFTADGGHDDLWESFGFNHHWLPPGVYHGECVDGTPREEYRAKVAFVGSWYAYGHTEYAPVREAMINALQDRYGDDFRAFPDKGQPRIVYPDLNDLYASVDVVVGDSCLAPRRDGQPITRYWSDRVSETTGRGGLLVHPYVEGLQQIHPSVPGWNLGDHEAMISIVDQLLSAAELRTETRRYQVEETRTRNTYRDRCREMLATIFSKEEVRV